MTNMERRAIRAHNAQMFSLKVRVTRPVRLLGSPSDLSTGPVGVQYKRTPGLLVREAMTDRIEQGLPR